MVWTLKYFLIIIPLEMIKINFHITVCGIVHLKYVKFEKTTHNKACW